MDQNLSDPLGSMEGTEEPLLDTYIGKNVLSRQQVNQAIMDIEDIHPLRESSKFDHICPKLKCMRKYSCCKPKPNFKFGLRKTLLKEMTLKIPSSETQLQEDPFLILGYGANAYFDIIESLFNMALFITIVMIPIMLVYSNNKINGLINLPGYSINKMSLGNYGASTVSCNIKSLGAGTMDFSCPLGIIDVKNPQIGVMNTGLKTMVYCTEKAIWEDPSNIEPAETCSGYMDKVKMYKRIIEKCYNKSECTISTLDWYKASTPASIRQLKDDKNICNQHAQVYLQMPCLIPADQTTDRRIFGLFAGCTVCFIYLFTVVYFDYVMTVQKNLYVDWDVKTITAGDYSTEHDIDNAAYLRWQEKYLDEGNPMSEIAQFKVYLQEVLEQRINAIEDHGYDPEGERDYKKTIAQISFAYHNSEVIGWLKERGNHLRQEQWEKVKHTQAHIKHELTKRESPLLDQLQTPVTAFVTWVTEEGLNRALSFNEEGYPQCKVLGQDIDIKKASEPTDIIWENRHFTQSKRNKRKIVVLFLITVILTISAIGMSYLEVASNSAKFKFPVRTCEGFKQLNSTAKGQVQWRNQAVKSFLVNQAYKKNHEKEHYDGTMECFCKAQSAADQNNQFEYQQPDGVIFKRKICSYYNHEMMISRLYAEAIPFTIIFVNFILKTCIIKLVEWAGEDVQSQQQASIANFVFAGQFFNTGLLLTFTNANLSEQWPYSLTKMVNNSYYDYTPNWYADVGQLIVQTMIIYAFIPYLNVLIGMGKPWLMRKLDNRWTNDPYNTKETSMAQYKDLYSGTDYVLHYKSAGIINITWVTMMYGTGLPILFPIAALNYLNSYICERIIVSFLVKLPPCMDETLTNNMISKCKYAPLLMMMNGYWMLSNPEIFLNKWDYIPTILNTHMKSQHFLSVKVDWAFPILIVALGSIFILLSQKFFGTTLTHMGYGMQRKEIQVDEDLPPFFEAIRLSQADEIIAEEENMQNNFGFLLTDPDTIEELEKVLYPKQSCVGTPWYNILSNPKYSAEFNYIGAYIQERQHLIEDGHADELDNNGEMKQDQIAIRCEQSDFIIVLLNLSCIPDDVIRKIDFMPGWQKRFKQHMNNYKVKWTERTPKELRKVEKWKYQCPELENLYREEMAKRENEDDDLKKDLEELQQKLDALEGLKQEEVIEEDDDFKKAEEASDEDKKSEEKLLEGGQDDYYHRFD